MPVAHTGAIERAWQGWRRLAHRAAAVQSRVLLYVLYFGLVAPFALIRRVVGKPPTVARPGWRSIASPPADLASARDQF